MEAISRTLRKGLWAALLMAFGCHGTARPAVPVAASASAGTTAKANALAQRVIIADGHIDVPYRLLKNLDADGKPVEDVTRKTEGGHFDHPRAVQGGLDAPFMSIYVPASFQKDGGAKAYADKMIDLVEGLVTKAPGKFAMAKSPSDVVANKAAGKVSLPMGIENGAALESLGDVGHFHGRGVRYVTLTHSKDNAICDSSYDEARTWKGLSPFGRKIVTEMNRLGIMVDISHVSDDTFYQVIELTKVPVIASHSSARHFTPGFQRNMSDDMIRKLAKNGGVIMINFGSSFVDGAAQKAGFAQWDAVKAFAEPKGLTYSDPAVKAFSKRYEAEHPPVSVPLERVVQHIDHVVKLVGVDHVGFGSDFDGVDQVPTGLEDVSRFPSLIAALLARGYSESDIEKIASGNLFRVWRAVEAHAAQR